GAAHSVSAGGDRRRDRALPRRPPWLRLPAALVLRQTHRRAALGAADRALSAPLGVSWSRSAVNRSSAGLRPTPRRDRSRSALRAPAFAGRDPSRAGRAGATPPRRPVPTGRSSPGHRTGRSRPWAGLLLRAIAVS